MIEQKEPASEGFFTRFWRGLRILAETTEVSQTELLARRVAQIERELRQSEEQRAKPRIGASDD